MQPASMLSTAVLLTLVPCALAMAGFSEDWDDPTAQNNDFFYYDESQARPEDRDVDANWEPADGDPNGFVWFDMGDATTFDRIPASTRNHWGVYTYDRFHSIDLALDPLLQVSIGKASGADLGGASLYFWLGEYIDPNEAIADDELYSFFYFDQALSIGDDAWISNSVEILATGWTTLVDNQGKSAADLLTSPDQWGFGIFGPEASTVAPDGQLAFDSLSFGPASNPVPNPGVAALLIGGLAGLGGLRRIKQRPKPTPAGAAA